MIDNDSSDGIVDHLRLDDRVTVVEMGANTGFSRANNAGIAATSARNILFLNPDTVVKTTQQVLQVEQQLGSSQ